MMVHRRKIDSLFDIPNELVDTIKKKIGEDEVRLKHVEDLLEQWMKCQSHLPDNYDRMMARNFVRGSKFNLEITKKKLEAYFLTKYAFPIFYRDRDAASEQLATVFRNVTITMLPKLTENGERICYMAMESPDPSDLDIVASIKLFWMMYDLTLTSDNPVVGNILIFDGKNVSAGHTVKFVSRNFIHYVRIFRDAYASRVCQIHVVNSPSFVEKAVSAVTPWLHEKVRERLMVHKGSDSLLNHLDPNVLPLEVGGNLESARSYMKRWQEFLVANADWFREQENVKIVGTPPEKIEKFSYDISLEGSFRQLNID